MNKLRVGLLGLVLVCVGLVVKAQDVNWQVRGGGDCATIIGGVTNIDTQFGYHLGGTADIALREDGVLRIQPSLLFSQKGWTFDGYYGSEQILEAKYSTRLHYLELPVPLAVRLRIGKECFVTFKFGPYVAYGLNAKTTMEVMNTDAKETFKANHFSKSCDFYGNAYDKEKRNVDYPKLNRWDVGVAEGIDLTLNHVIVGVNLFYGLTPLCRSGFMGNPVANVLTSLMFGRHPKNFTVGLSLGYQF